MRSIWKGAITFGLVTIPVKLYSATEERDVSFHQVHRADGGRIRYRRVCQVCGEEVQYADIAKGYEMSSGEVVVLTDEDFADLPLSTSRAIDVLRFVPLEQVDPIYFAKSYYLEPEKSGTKPYVLLRDALEGSDRVALVKVALRQREALATLRVRDGVFVLETMLWPDEVRTPEFGFLDDDVEVRPQELAMAESLIETMTGDFAPEEYHDAYREALQSLISAKVEGREVVVPEQPETPATVVDLMSALRASVEQAKSARAGARAPAPAATDEMARSRGARRTGTKPAGTKQPAAKRATAKAARATGTTGTAKKSGTPATRKGAPSAQSKKAGTRKSA